jgi:hypothetical protein
MTGHPAAPQLRHASLCGGPETRISTHAEPADYVVGARTHRRYRGSVTISPLCLLLSRRRIRVGQLRERAEMLDLPIPLRKGVPRSD